jgi:seryl-tRNA synthetase
LIQDFKKDINNSLKEIQENTAKQVMPLKRKHKNSSKNYRKTLIEQVKELTKTIQGLKMEVETIKKSLRETTLEIENLGKRSGVTDEHQQQNKRENLRSRRYHRKH